MSDQDNVISTDQLQIGIYVYLDVGWMHHPFSFNNFKIKSESQLATIQSLGLKQVRWDPNRSDLKPLAPGQKRPPAPPSASQPSSPPAQQPAPKTTAAMDAAAKEIRHDAEIAVEEAAFATKVTASDPTSAAANAAANAINDAGAALHEVAVALKEAGAGADDAVPNEAEVIAATKVAIANKQVQVERLQQQRAQIANVQIAFAGTVTTIRNITKNIFSQPKETIRQSEHVIREMVDVFLAAPEVAIQVMNEKPGGEDVYLHALNVSVLSMMIGRELKLSAAEVNVLGMGCLFHDIGMTEIPSKILSKGEPLTKSERDFLQMHTAYGLDIAKRVGLPEAVQTIIYRHHELHDGSGYPQRLKGEAIDVLSRIVAIAEHYDELCNPVNIAAAMTPHEALSLMFAQQRAKFDPRLLQIFIRCLGVFPPGTVVRLNNDVVGLVISINAARPLKPSIIVYDADVPKQDAIIVDLDDEPDINISQAIRPSLLPKAVYDYLSPRKRVSYYFDPDAGKPPKPA